MDISFINGFSKFDQTQRIEKISEFTSDPARFRSELKKLLHPDPDQQSIMNGFSENTLTNFPLPYGIAPNFLINEKTYAVPMVIEESSVVAAASAAAKFWYSHGGFKAQIMDRTKSGQIYFSWNSDPQKLAELFPEIREFILTGIAPLTARMEKRGGGVKEIQLKRLDEVAENLFKLDFSFMTADSMGANFINSVLEESANLLKIFLEQKAPELQKDFDLLMCILSNYTPNCRIRVELNIKTAELNQGENSRLSARIIKAMNVAENDISRAVTHNKGIFNGIDAVLMATGNDYRAVEAGAHAYACRDGRYRSLSYARETGSDFIFGMEIPLSLGTVGGLTSLHPLAKWSLDILHNPGSDELMMIAAAAGLANNYSAVKSLVTTGIQKGHMKLHLENILNFMGADGMEKKEAYKHFADKTVSYSEVEKFLKKK